MGARSHSMNSVLTPTCPHGLRPGTTVCLHCRQEQRLAARKERYLIAARFGIATAGVGVVLAVIIGGVLALAPSSSTAHTVDGADTATVTQAAKTVKPVTRAAARPAQQRLIPAISEGRRELGDSMFAVREGFQVTVHFDTDELRTRFDWKFEGVVRATLPIVFGAEARAALDSVPEGSLARDGDLLNDLPTKGIALDLPSGTELRVWPITRPGRDGPIVVGYRATGSGS